MLLCAFVWCDSACVCAVCVGGGVHRSRNGLVAVWVGRDVWVCWLKDMCGSLRAHTGPPFPLVPLRPSSLLPPQLLLAYLLAPFLHPLNATRHPWWLLQVLDKDFTLPIGKAKVMRSGRDVTLVAFSKMVGHSLAAAEQLAKEGIDAEVINLRSIKPLDRATIVASVCKTHALVSVEEGWPQSGVGAEIAALAMEECFDDLDAPVGRVTGADIPTPYAANLEVQVFPQVSDIVARVKATLGR